VYKRLVRKKKRIHECDQIRHMENTRHAQPRLFARKRTNQCTIATADFFQYFSGLQANMFSVSDDVAGQFCASNDFDVDSFKELDRPITVAKIESAI
jgi:hypothetical protein